MKFSYTMILAAWTLGLFLGVKDINNEHDLRIDEAVARIAALEKKQAPKSGGSVDLDICHTPIITGDFVVPIATELPTIDPVIEEAHNSLEFATYVDEPTRNVTVKEVMADLLKAEYDRGVKEALETIMLHDVELGLSEEKMTWGERAEVVMKRLKVTK